MNITPIVTRRLGELLLALAEAEAKIEAQAAEIAALRKEVDASRAAAGGTIYDPDV